MKAKIIIIFLLGLPLTLYAYVGPGAGISFLGAFWAVISAILLAIGGFLIWPIRAMLNRRKFKKQSSEAPEDI